MSNQINQSSCGGWIDWAPAQLEETRIELLGDSKIITNWCNGCWPVRNPRHLPRVDKNIQALMSWCGWGARPRTDGAQWIRHVLRKFNKSADYLANLGKALGNNEFRIDVGSKQHFRFLRGFWDGGHSQGKEVVGVGVILQGVNEHPNEETEWKTIMVGYGKCDGRSATTAEMQAFTWLVEIVTLRLKHDYNLTNDHDFAPWKDQLYQQVFREGD